ncbi:MAG: hypothetical protein Q8Q37_02020 [bacterium]|nr:hypothetical protein [bacterium]
MLSDRKKIVVGLDMDGVIIDSTVLKIAVAKKLGFNLRPDEAQPGMIEAVLPSAALNILRELVYFDPVAALKSLLVRGAKDGLDLLKKSDLEYFLISRRPQQDIAKQLLVKNKLWPDYFNSSNTFFVKDADAKNTKAAMLEVTHYLDDQPKVLEKLVNIPNKFLLDRFDNFANMPFEHIHVASWKHFLKHII